MMNKLFRKKLTRGGFTLAELLIVVAIIAILVAVAVPIFIQSLKEARVAVHEANIRSVRISAIHAILTDQQDPTTGTGSLYEKGKEKGWVAVATVSRNGQIQNITVHTVNQPPETDGVSKDGGKSWTEPENADWAVPDSDYQVRAVIHVADVSLSTT